MSITKEKFTPFVEEGQNFRRVSGVGMPTTRAVMALMVGMFMVVGAGDMSVCQCVVLGAIAESRRLDSESWLSLVAYSRPCSVPSFYKGPQAKA